MRPSYRFLFIGFAYFFFTTPSQACSCFWIETFCNYVQENEEWEHYPRIIRGEVLSYENYPLDTLDDGWVWMAPLVHVYVKEMIYGDEIGSDTLTFYGQDGLNCAAPLSWLGGGTDFVFFVPFVNPDGLYDWTFPAPRVTEYPLTELPGCGPSFLSVTDGLVAGPLYPEVNQMTLNEFRSSINDCVGFTGNEETESLQDLLVFPNPATDLLRVTHRPAEVQKMQLLDLHGRIVQEILTPATSVSEHELDVSDLPAGVYMLSLTNEGKRVTRRVVVQ